MIHPVLALTVKTELDVLAARRRARQIASLCAFTMHDQVRIATVVSELARNIYNQAASGQIEFAVDGGGIAQTLVIRISEKGSGVGSVESIQSAGQQSETAIIGIIAAQRLMDGCTVTSSVEEGTMVVLNKFLPSGAPILAPEEIESFVGQLGVLQDNVALAEVQQQNRELIQALAALKTSQDDLLRLAQELRATNETVVALNAELENKAEQLQRADLRKDAFLAILAHELRSPLAATMMAASVLETASLPQSRIVELGQIISRQGKHMSRMVEDLLDVSRVSRGLVSIENKPVDMRQVVRTTVEQLNPFIVAKSHSLTLSLSDEQCWVSGDMIRLVQVTSNLLGNAVRYTDHGGEIAVELLADQDMVTLRVADNGTGIDADLMPRLFGLYVQAELPTNGKAGGLGLGLALVKSIVELHDGSVTAHSGGKGQGSLFQVCLPRTRRLAA